MDLRGLRHLRKASGLLVQLAANPKVRDGPCRLTSSACEAIRKCSNAFGLFDATAAAHKFKDATGLPRGASRLALHQSHPRCKRMPRACPVEGSRLLLFS